MNYLLVGASRNIGYEASLRLLAQGNTVTFLLRRKDTFDADSTIQKYIKSGHVKLCIGDGLKQEDVRSAWAMASSDGTEKIDAVLITVGTLEGKFSLTKGFIINPANLVTMCVFNVLASWPKDMSPQPKLVALTSNGLTKRSHNALPFLLRITMYGWILDGPHADKLGVERLLYHAAGWEWKEREIEKGILPDGWQTAIGGRAWLRDPLIVRPALLTSGKCVADEKDKPYRTGPEDLKSAWTVSRKDVAHWIVQKAIPNWDSWKGKQVTIAY